MLDVPVLDVCESDFVFLDPSVLAFSKKHSPVLHSVLASTLYSFLSLLLPCLYSCALSISSLFTTFCHLPNGHWQLEIHTLKSHWNYSDFHMYFFQMYFFHTYFSTHTFANVLLHPRTFDKCSFTVVTCRVTSCYEDCRENCKCHLCQPCHFHDTMMPWLPFPRLK